MTRQRNADTTGFELTMQEEEALNSGSHTTETLGWFAIEHGGGDWSGHAYEAGATGDNLSDDPRTISFGQTFADEPEFFAALSSFDGGDPANLRLTNLTTGGVSLQVDEETSFDAEVAHTTESADYFAILGTGLLHADPIIM